MMNRRLKNRNGATLAVVAVSLIALLAAISLAVDMGMMYSAHNEAQRTADASALAGASAFLDYNPSAATPYATQRARDYITGNDILGQSADPNVATITVDPSGYTVEVKVRRPKIGTWFARVFGIDSVGVSAIAQAEAVNAGGARCVRPWAVQDMWHELSPTGERMAQEGDAFGNGDGDRYQPVNVEDLNDPTATGYGANNPAHPVINSFPDWGRQIQLKAQSPTQNPNTGATEVAQPGPGEFLIWDMPEDPNMVQCAKSGLDYSNEICGCNANVINLGDPYPLDFGAKVGSTFMGLDALLDQDRSAVWDESTNSVAGSAWGRNWKDSPRVVPIALMAPLPPPADGATNYTASNLRTVTFTNFALFFVESYKRLPGGQPQVTGRFLYYAPGVAGHTAGPTVKYLRLVK